MGYLDGFGVTIKKWLTPGSDSGRRVTTEYPEVVRPKPERFHGRHVLNRYDDGMEKCIGCELCAGVCPAKCIYVRGADNDPDDPTSPGERFGFIYEINYLRCIHCDLCVEACPTEAITESKLFEFAFTNRSDAIYTKAELVVGDDGRPQQLPWENWDGGYDPAQLSSGWMRATAPGGDADFVGIVAWAAELGYGVRAPEGGGRVDVPLEPAADDKVPAAVDHVHARPTDAPVVESSPRSTAGTFDATEANQASADRGTPEPVLLTPVEPSRVESMSDSGHPYEQPAPTVTADPLGEAASALEVAATGDAATEDEVTTGEASPSGSRHGLFDAGDADLPIEPHLPADADPMRTAAQPPEAVEVVGQLPPPASEETEERPEPERRPDPEEPAGPEPDLSSSGDDSPGAASAPRSRTQSDAEEHAGFFDLPDLPDESDEPDQKSGRRRRGRGRR